LVEAHMRKILKSAPQRSFTHYYRLSHRGAINARRSRLLERLLARANAATVVTDWRADAYRVIAPQSTAMPGLGATALYAERGPVAAGSVFIATPVHYVAEMSNVRLAADGILSLRQSDADALAADFNRLWSDAGIRMLAGANADLFCLADHALEAVTSDPEDVLDRHIDNYLPAGCAAPRLRQLMSEIEMWLFEHAVNRARIAAAATVMSGLWIWGGGASLRSMPPVAGWTAGDDMIFNAFAASADSQARPASGVVVLGAEPGTDAWAESESRWLEPSVEDLSSGRIARLDLSAGNRCFSVSPGWRRRFWRRDRPWWEFFA
jgi:hypothetical protein